MQQMGGSSMGGGKTANNLANLDVSAKLGVVVVVVVGVGEDSYEF